ncbi:hypothetical protein SCHPADRAFT_719739 [Schizopora paradoxa]|uniref:Uncharacterized protein n=1 Tax=Schizopora paradoxa TaxID=27342 RepID=A0A0H2R1I8_9AGAM|nr:hypothetical protein SCHPADRAFT_719739 [Schizopora paradoxa]
MTEEEINLIIGKRKSLNASVAMEFSYWPDLGVVAGTQLDSGCWTPTNEAWFKQRLIDLHSGKAYAIHQNEWGEILKRNPWGSERSRRILQHTRKAAEKFLAK